jgi:hypothetical protein
MYGEHGIADTSEESPRHYSPDESSTPLRDEVKTGPDEHIGIVDDNPGGTRAIESDAHFDVIRDGDRSRSGTRLLTRERKDGDARCSILLMLDRDDHTRTWLAAFDLTGGLFIRPKEMVIDNLADLRLAPSIIRQSGGRCESLAPRIARIVSGDSCDTLTAFVDRPSICLRRS